MATHVTIVDGAARRTVIKVQPGTYLSDVLSQVCQKLKLSSDQFTLRHNKKPVDLSRTFRLSGLPGGAQLELVQGSRSPTVVNIALQLPDSEGSRRLTDKFASTTSFWQVLRGFESGAAGGSDTAGAATLNITQRGTPQTQSGSSGAGRLYYEMPTIHVMGRELASFVDLQKTFGQLGISGSALLRLSFKSSGQPLEEAMLDITRYFTDSEGVTPAHAKGEDLASKSGTVDPAPAQTASSPQDLADDLTRASNTAELKGSSTPMEGVTSDDLAATASNEGAVNTTNQRDVKPDNAATDTTSTKMPVARGIGERNIRIFHAPDSNTPLAAAQGFNQADFVPTVAHAQAHQARLNNEGRNKRLASDKELATQDLERQEKLAKVESVRIRVRFPDMESLEMDFGREDSAKDVYAQVRALMLHPDAHFALKLPGTRGPQLETLPEDDTRVISGLGWRGGLQIHMIWADDVAASVRRDPCLSEQWRSRRQHFDKPPDFKTEEDEAKTGQAGDLAGGQKKQRSEENKLSVEDKMKKFLRFGKK